MRALVGLVVLVAWAGPTSAQAAEVHLGLTDGDPANGLAVQWLSATPEIDPQVVVTTPSGDVAFPGALVPGPAAGFVYEATLAGLEAGSDLSYDIGGTSYALSTLPPPGATVSFVALGDMGVGERAAGTVHAIEDIAPDLVLHAGDLSYAEGNQLEWKTWFDLVEPVASRVPWLPALGNHEVGPLGIGNTPASTEVLYYRQRFTLPNNELWYSFDAGPVHFVALDTFSDAMAPSADEAAWLAEDLAAHSASAWTVVFLHEPPYSSNEHGSSARVQDLFVPLFDEHGVDLVIAAHDHAYERTYPLTGGSVTTRALFEYAEGHGIVYVVTGGGGESLYEGWEEPAPEWSAARGSFYHVTSCTASDGELACAVVPTPGDGVTDRFRIFKARPAPGPSDAGDTDETPVLVLVALAALALAALARRRPE